MGAQQYSLLEQGCSRCYVDPRNGDHLECHDDLWFTDGSVILRAEHTIFRVHMSQLSRHSEVFRDMFGLAGKGNVDDLEGCPLIFLHDAASDLESLLISIYDGPTFGDNGDDDFRVTAGILRLSTKYIIEGLRQKALDHLSRAWPSTLRGWDLREERGQTQLCRIYPSPIAVINLAQEVEAPQLLPAAFYDLCRYPFCQIFDPQEDGSIHDTRFSLSVADMQRLCLGKEMAQHTITTLIQAMGTSQYLRTSQPSFSHVRRTSAGGICTSAAACRKDFAELVDLATQHYLFDRERGFCDPLYVAEELGQLKSADLSECKPCAQSLEAWAAKERQKLWKTIPLWFRLTELHSASPQPDSPRSPA
ncbi:hypothetical protein CYLTODRAFT_422661 [Cylindrobasidium torrendii FP15055 ss-10]|uniref:BTB domain-containing protein n=1 Tax=Cylindrobasidium torrendii FP15055 ss-10 TaxID=1314674 RepID=A0A0D7BAX7_9AGAR|nr:hypothetical protein CYLTODRAFT_422661 [Cylindrobasidium torrendii FP15055 ss-10]